METTSTRYDSIIAKQTKSNSVNQTGSKVGEENQKHSGMDIYVW